jgi:hypothetical protein
LAVNGVRIIEATRDALKKAIKSLVKKAGENIKAGRDIANLAITNKDSTQ